MTTVVVFLLLAIALFLIIFAFGIFIFFLIDLFLVAPYVPTKIEKLKIMIKLAQIRKGEQVLDLGSGDGRLVIAAAKKGGNAIGVELNPFLVFFSRFLIWRERLSKNAKIIRENFWQTDLKKADVVFVYSHKKMMGKLGQKIFSQIKKGTRVISNDYQFPNRKYRKEKNKVFLYQDLRAK